MTEDFPVLHFIAVKLCKYFGHNWLYKDYSNHMKENGDAYDFKASRNCTRCNQNAYFYTEWKNEDKAEMDNESDFQLLKKIRINQVTYTKHS